MNPLYRSEGFVPMSRSAFRKEIVAAGGTKKQADEHYRKVKHEETWRNELYIVQVNRDAPHAFGDSIPGGMFELSIRRADRGAARDWRHFQQIKNQIIGPENEAVELFPAESRLRDAANQFWLYGFNDPRVTFPFGMLGRHVDDKQEFGASKQRKFDEDEP